MVSRRLRRFFFLFIISGLLFSGSVTAEGIPDAAKKIMQEPRYAHASWGILVKDLNTGKVLIDQNASKIFLPASTTKLFTASALLHTFGLNYKFRTPVYADGKIENGVLRGNLILVGKGDLILGGRLTADNKIAYTPIDHSYANILPGATLTKEDPLAGIIDLAKQVKQHGINTIKGNVLIDTRFFTPTIQRGFTLSPVFINENLFDVVVTPGNVGETAHLNWRPQVPTVTVVNNVKTVSDGKSTKLEFSENKDKSIITVSGTIGINQKQIVNVYPMTDPSRVAHDAFVQALKQAGVTVIPDDQSTHELPAFASYKNLQPIAELISPPLLEYAKLLLKVSHNIGSDLVPLLLATAHHEKSYNEGMKYIGDVVTNVAGVDPSLYALVDAAGGNDNRVSPLAEVQLLNYWYQQKPVFEKFVYTLPVMGVNGDLADIGVRTAAKGHVFAKTGTGIVFSGATQKFFLTSKALGGYIHAKNGHWLAFMIVVNNATLNDGMQEVFLVMEELGEVAATIYDNNPGSGSPAS